MSQHLTESKFFTHVNIGGRRLTILEAAGIYGMATEETIYKRLRSGKTDLVSVFTPESKSKIPETYFGMHIMMDLYGCSYESSSDLDRIFEYLDKLPGTVGMRKISQPHVFKYGGGKLPNSWGITGSVILASSHISCHTFPDCDGFVTMDLYSCQNFNPVLVIEKTAFVFDPEKFDIYIERRGKLFDRGMYSV